MAIFVHIDASYKHRDANSGGVWRRAAGGAADTQSPEFGFGSAEDAVGLLHLRPAVAGVVHLQTVIELVQILLHLLDLLTGHVLQPETHLHHKHSPSVSTCRPTHSHLTHRSD